MKGGSTIESRLVFDRYMCMLKNVCLSFIQADKAFDFLTHGWVEKPVATRRVSDPSATMTSLDSFRSILLFYCLHNISGQICPGTGAKLIQATQLQRYDLETCDDVTDYSEHLTSFLSNCTFTRSTEITGKGGCHYECLYGSGTCYAMTYTAAGGCEICRPTSESGNGNSYPRDDVFVAGWNLKIHVNG